VASKAEVQKQLEILFKRLGENSDNVRAAIPDRKVLRCQVTDLDTAWHSVIEGGQVSRPTETPPSDGRVDITLRVGSDDLVDLIEGRQSFLSAFTSGRVKVDASIMDLLRLRTLL
jgi:putative sterol carrier protein